MEIAEVHAAELPQIGGGAGWVADQLREARLDAVRAMEALDGAGDVPVIGPYPHQAALAAAREAQIHLTEALCVEAPEDALIDTRHALEELTATIAMLENTGPGIPVRPGDPPAARFQRTLELLVAAEHKLMDDTRTLVAPMPAVMVPLPVTTDPETPHVMNDNGGVVPPWLQ